jgi:DNA-binding SARP family transcriptional activator
MIMSDKIKIRLFDGFEIRKGDMPILKNLSNTRKTKLFVAYLLVNRDRPITHQELFELLWSGEDYANPATALRTLLYRFRSMIDSEGADALAGAIISHRGTYQWNRDLDVSIDALDFHALAEAGLDPTISASRRKEYLAKAVDMYSGPLLPDFSSEPWLIAKSASYRDMYIEAVMAYIDLLKVDNQPAKIVQICERALELAGTSELLELESQIARLSIADPDASTKDSVVSYYNEVRELSVKLQDEADRMQAELQEDVMEQQAYLCDYGTFKDLYNLQRRVQSRSKATIFLGLVYVRFDTSENGDPLYGEKTMKAVLSLCQRMLRLGDAICRKADYEIAIMFPAESYEDAVGVLERLKLAIKERAAEDIVVVYRVRPLKSGKE